MHRFILPIAALLTACGGRGGYEADRAMPALEARVRAIQDAQETQSATMRRLEQRLYDLQRQQCNGPPATARP